MADVDERTFYEAVGGRPTFERLVATFYQGVAADPTLRAMYPEEDLAPAQERLGLFLEQYWGGPSTYSERRGHPRLRMRHAPYAITHAAKDRWLSHMRHAVETLTLDGTLTDDQAATLWEYLERAALFMVNTTD